MNALLTTYTATFHTRCVQTSCLYLQKKQLDVSTNKLQNQKLISIAIFMDLEQLAVILTFTIKVLNAE